MHVFWQHGYEATSLNELTSAMGVTPPSIYAAFGDKKKLFLEVVALYLSGPITADTIINGAATARDAALGLLRAAAMGFTGCDTPRGCLLASSALSCSAAAADVQSELASIRRRIEAKLKSKIVRGVRAHELPADTDADALAGHVMAVIQGMSTLARDGASQKKLLRLTEVAMRSWPIALAAKSRPKRMIA